MEALVEAAQVSEPLGQAFEAWRAWAVDGPPRWNIGQLLDFPAGLLPWAMVFAREPAGGDFRVQFWGSSWTPFFGHDFTDQLVSAAEAATGGAVCRTCMRVCDDNRPSVLHADFADAAGAACSYYRVALPFRRPASAAADVAVVLHDPRLITRQLCRAWDVPPPLFLERRAAMT